MIYDATNRGGTYHGIMQALWARRERKERRSTGESGARGHQRYKCKECGYNFVVGDGRVDPNAAVKRAFAVILYSLGKGSYGFIAKLFGVTPPAVLCIRKPV